MSYRITVKNGDTHYAFNTKANQYDFDYVDYVEEPSDLGDALFQFLEWVNDPNLEDKVTLSFTPKKNKKNKKIKNA